MSILISECYTNLGSLQGALLDSGFARCGWAIDARLKMSHEELLDRARGGDADAIDRILEQQRRLIAGYIIKRVRSRDDADDILQNVLIRASRHFTNFRGDCPLSNWLIRIAANELKNYYNRVIPNRSQETSFDGFDDHLFSSPNEADHVESNIMIQNLFEAMERACTPPERMVLMLVYQGESSESVSELLAMNAATVRSHLLRGRSKLLAHIFLNEPHLAGGREAIESAFAKAGNLTQDEQDAFMSPAGKTEQYRTVCVKVAQFLTLPCGLIFAIGGLVR